MIRRVVKSKYTDLSWEYKVVNREPECRLWEGFYSMLYDIQERCEESNITDYAVSTGQIGEDEVEQSESYTYVYAEDERAMDVAMRYIDNPAAGINVEKHLGEYPIFLQAVEDYASAQDELRIESYAEDYDEERFTTRRYAL